MTDNISIVTPVIMQIDFPLGYILLFVGLVLMFINFFIKSPLIYMALIAVWFGVFFSQEFINTWLQWVSLPIVFWAGIGFFFRVRNRNERGY